MVFVSCCYAEADGHRIYLRTSLEDQHGHGAGSRGNDVTQPSDRILVGMHVR